MVGGVIVLTNTRTLLNSDWIDAPDPVRYTVYGLLYAVWAAAVVHSYRQYRKDRVLESADDRGRRGRDPGERRGRRSARASRGPAAGSRVRYPPAAPAPPATEPSAFRTKAADDSVLLVPKLSGWRGVAPRARAVGRAPAGAPAGRAAPRSASRPRCRRPTPAAGGWAARARRARVVSTSQAVRASSAGSHSGRCTHGCTPASSSSSSGTGTHSASLPVTSRQMSSRPPSVVIPAGPVALTAAGAPRARPSRPATRPGRGRRPGRSAGPARRGRRPGRRGRCGPATSPAGRSGRAGR